MDSFLTFGFSKELVNALLASSFLVIVIVSDTKYLIIPDEVTLFMSVALIIFRFVTQPLNEAFSYLLSGVFLFFVMYGIMLLGNKMFKKESLGGADIKLMFFVGVSVGTILGLFSIFLSSIIALPLSLVLYMKSKDNVIPYGPFILLALVIIILFKISPDVILGI